MFATAKWLSILILISALINFIQESFGIITTPPLGDNNLIQFFYVSLAPLFGRIYFSYTSNWNSFICIVF